MTWGASFRSAVGVQTCEKRCSRHAVVRFVGLTPDKCLFSSFLHCDGKNHFCLRYSGEIREAETAVTVADHLQALAYKSTVWLDGGQVL
jgi:hypothetical protein